MTPRERVLRTIQFQDTDIVPYHVSFTDVAHRKLADYYGDDDFAGRIGNHLASLSHRRLAPWVEVEPGFYRDEWGVIWNRIVDRDIGMIEGRVLSEASLGDYQLPDPRSVGLFERYPAFVEENQDKFRIASLGFSLFERGWSLRGMDMLLVDMIESPEFVHELLDRIMEFTLAQVDMALAFDIDCVYFGDDWGSQSGLIMGPDLWREFIKPRITRMYRRVSDAGKYVLIHSCGDVKAVLPDLVDAGLNIFNPFQPETMDVFETKERYYDKLSFYGGISVQRLLPHGTPDEVRRETRRLVQTLGKGGGYIASPSHAIPADVPAKNMVAMIETLQNQ